MRHEATIAVLAAAFTSVAVLCQVTAHTDRSRQLQQVESPMVLEIPLSDFAGQPEKKEWATSEPARFVCLGVTLKQLTLKCKVDKKTKKLEVHGIVLLRNVGGEDTYTTIFYELVRKDQVLCLDQERKFSTEEDEDRERRFQLKTPCDAPECLKDCTLRITVEVVPE